MTYISAAQQVSIVPKSMLLIKDSLWFEVEEKNEFVVVALYVEGRAAYIFWLLPERGIGGSNGSLPILANALRRATPGFCEIGGARDHLEKRI